jgi:hypothetical protein
VHVQKFVVGTWEILCTIIGIPPVPVKGSGVDLSFDNIHQPSAHLIVTAEIVISGDSLH